MLRRVLAGALLVGTVAAAALGVPVAQAGPQQQSTTCGADLILDFRPGLTLSESEQRIKVRGTLSDCVGGGVLSATVNGRGSGTLSCTSGSADATGTVRWNTGETSKVAVSVDVSNGTVSGMVIAGKFAGEEVTGDLTLEPVEGDCFFTPVTRGRATGTVSL